MITYRRATAADIKDLVRLRMIFLEEIQRDVTRRDAEKLHNALICYFTEGMQNSGYIAWLALDGEKIVATSGLTFQSVPPSFRNPTGRVAYIMNMYTLPAYRRQGIASALFETIIKEARRLGYTKLSLHATEMGRSLYSRYGFRDEKKEMVLRLD